MTGNRKQSGFTMIEAMLSVMILAVAATGVIVPFATGAAVQAEAANRSLGAKLAGDLLEKITADDFYTIEGISVVQFHHLQFFADFSQNITAARMPYSAIYRFGNSIN